MGYGKVCCWVLLVISFLARKIGLWIHAVCGCGISLELGLLLGFDDSNRSLTAGLPIGVADSFELELEESFPGFTDGFELG